MGCARREGAARTALLALGLFFLGCKTTARPLDLTRLVGPPEASRGAQSHLLMVVDRRSCVLTDAGTLFVFLFSCKQTVHVPFCRLGEKEDGFLRGSRREVASRVGRA